MDPNRQFPPSSPLLNAEIEHSDIFDSLSKSKHLTSLKSNSIDKQKDDAYLTPDPSSSLGDVTMVSDNNNSENDESMIRVSTNSSPSKIVNYSNKKLKTNSNSKIDISQPLNPKNFKNVIHIPLNGDIFKIGRSGISCSFKLNSKNKLISRIHAEIYYNKDSNMVILKCLGFNGLNITIPKLINVEQIKEKYFLIKINQNNDNYDNDTSSEMSDSSESRILSKSSNFTNFYMLKGETIQMPMIEGTVLDFRGELALLDYQEPNLLNMNLSSKYENLDNNEFDLPNSSNMKRTRKLLTSDLLKIVEQKKLQFSTHPTLAELKNRGKNDNIINIKCNNYIDKLTGARPIEKRDLANTIIYKRPSPSPISTQNNVKLDSDRKHDELSSVNLVNESTEPISKFISQSSCKVLSKQIESNKAIIKPIKSILGDITNQNINKIVKTSDNVKKIEKPKPIVRILPEQSNFAEKENKERDQTPEIFKENVVNVNFTNVNDKNNNNENNNNIDNNNDTQKKKGRPKKIKQTEEDKLRSIPKEEIDKILSTIPEFEDIVNLITNHIAYSRVLQTPFSSIIELNSIKKHNLTKLQLRCLLIHSIDCIGVIFRQGKDAAGKPLDEEYYYIPEKDLDIQRVQLVEELKGSSSHLRSCRKTHKQYFWKKPKI